VRSAATKHQQTYGPHDNSFSVNLPSASAERSGYSHAGAAVWSWREAGVLVVRPRTAINLGRAPQEVNLLRLSGALKPPRGQRAARPVSEEYYGGDGWRAAGRARSTTKLRCLGIHRRRTPRPVTRLMPRINDASPCHAKTSPRPHTGLISIYSHYTSSRPR